MKERVEIGVVGRLVGFQVELKGLSLPSGKSLFAVPEAFLSRDL